MCEGLTEATGQVAKKFDHTSTRAELMTLSSVRGEPAYRLEQFQEVIMGRGILLWLLGIPLPIVILLVLFLR